MSRVTCCEEVVWVGMQHFWVFDVEDCAIVFDLIFGTLFI